MATKENTQVIEETDLRSHGGHVLERKRTIITLEVVDLAEVNGEQIEQEEEEDFDEEEFTEFEEELVDLEQEEPSLKVKKCKKRKKKKKGQDIVVQKPLKGEGDDARAREEEYEGEDEEEEEWEEGEEWEGEEEEEDDEGEEEGQKVDVTVHQEGGEKEEDSEDNSDEYTTCSSTEELGPRWDDKEEDELGFLKLKDPGICEALQLVEEIKEWIADGGDAYIESCKAFGIAPIKTFFEQRFSDTLDLRFYGVNAKNIRSLAQALKYNPYVKKLDLTEAKMDEAAVYEIAELIRENTTLTTIILKNCHIGPEGMKYLAETLDLSATLENLDLSDNGLGDEGIEILSPTIARNLSLKSLDFSFNQIGQKGAKALGTALKENKTLAELKLRWNNLYEDPEKGLKVLLSTLSRPEIPFENLDLSWNALGESSAPFIRTLMLKAPLLRELLIDHNRFPDAGALAIKRGLAKAENLEIFRMGFNPMTFDAAYALLSAVKPSLKVFDIDGICVQKNFLKLMQKKLKDQDTEIIYGEVLSNYVLSPVDTGKVLLLRARFEGMKPKKKKAQRDFGHLLLELKNEDITLMLPEDFKQRVKASKIKIRDELIQGIVDEYKNKRNFVTVEVMLEKYMELFPDTELPPPKPKKEKKQKKAKGEGKKKEKAEYRKNALSFLL